MRFGTRPDDSRWRMTFYSKITMGLCWREYISNLGTASISTVLKPSKSSGTLGQKEPNQTNEKRKSSVSLISVNKNERQHTIYRAANSFETITSYYCVSQKVFCVIHYYLSLCYYFFLHFEAMKIVGLAIVRTGSDLNEPIPLTVATELSSFGFFQRQVSLSISVDFYFAFLWKFQTLF